MQWLQVDAVDKEVVTAMAAQFGSLAIGSYWSGPWADLFRALRNEDGPGAAVAAADIVAGAVPEEGSPHPQRATIVETGPWWVEFETPGGVRFGVGVYEDPPEGQGPFYVQLNFQRDSRWQAFQVLSAALGQGAPETAVMVDATHQLHLAGVPRFDLPLKEAAAMAALAL